MYDESDCLDLIFLAVRAKRAEDSPTSLLEELVFELNPTSYLVANRRPFSLILHLGSEKMGSTSGHYILRQIRELSGLKLPARFRGRFEG